MQKRMIWTLITLLVFCTITGCDKKSGLKGKVLDDSGWPYSGIKVIVKQTQPIKGYEQFETITNSDGTFYFEHLYPLSDYILFVQHMANGTIVLDEKTHVFVGSEGDTLLLREPIVIVKTDETSFDKYAKTGIKLLENLFNSVSK